MTKISVSHKFNLTTHIITSAVPLKSKLPTLLLLICIALLTACAGKTSPKKIEQNHVIDKIEQANPNICMYKGQAIIRLYGELSRKSVPAIIEKNCDDYVHIRFLGAFGTTQAEAFILNGRLSVFQELTEITDWLEIDINSVVTLVTYLSNPPFDITSGYTMRKSARHYSFSDATHDIVYSSDYILKYIYDNVELHRINYEWSNNNLTSVEYVDGINTIKVEFKGTWK